MSIQVGPSTYGPLDRMLATASNLQAQMDTLQQQTTTGKVAASYSGLAAQASQAIDLASALRQGDTYMQSIGYAQGKASVMQDSLTQVQALAARVSQAALTLTGSSSPDAVRGVAEQARLALQQVASLMNGTYGGDYVFAGADTANAPVPNPDAITTSGFYTQIGTEVAALATVPTSPPVGMVIANTVSIASSTAAGTTPFSTYLIGPGLSAARVTVEVTQSQKIVLDLPANQNVGGNSNLAIGGTGNAVSDIMRALAVVANTTGPMAANPDLRTLMGDAARTLTSAGATVTEEASAIGIAQQAMTVAAAGHASMKTLVRKQLSSLTDVDMAATISHLRAVTEQLQASYKVLSLAKSLSLSNYL